MWRNLVYLYLIYLVAEGALRKWVLPQFSNELFIVKDLILGAALIALAGEVVGRRGPRYLSRNELGIWGLWVVLFCAFGLIAGWAITTLVGLRYYLGALPLALVIPHFLKDWHSLRRLVKIALVITIGICVLGVVQYTSSLDSDINRYAWTKSGEDISTFGVDADQQMDLAVNRPRITGTFSYISPYASFLQFMFLLAWVAALTATTPRDRLLAFTALFAIFMNIAMTGSRAPALISVLVSLPFLVLLVRRGASGLYQAMIAFAVVAASVGGLYVFSDPFTMLMQRDETAGDTEARILGALFAPVVTVMNSSWLGEGLGATFQGLGELGRIGSAGAIFDEVNVDRVGTETGIIGYVFVLAVKVVYVVKTWGLANRARAFEIRLWTWAILGYQLAFLWAVPLYNAVASAFYFAAIGLYYWLRYQNAIVLASRQEVPRRSLASAAYS